MAERRYQNGYSERVRLRDGRVVEFRLMQVADADLLRRGFEHLSDRSRYQRFCSPKPRLSDAEVRYFTRVDGEKHFAIGAVEVKDGEEEGLGVARFIRHDDHPEIAEPAVVVVDEAQGIGLGGALMMRLLEAAHERGVRTFEFLTLFENAALAKMLAGLPGDAVEPLAGGYKRIRVDRVIAAAHAPSPAPMPTHG